MTTGDYNTAVGSRALDECTTGASNTAVGGQALDNLTTGSQNVAIGVNALDTLTTASQNSGVGYQVFEKQTTAQYNCGLGFQAGAQLTSASNSNLLGWRAGYGITSGANNTCIGTEAGNYSTTITTGAQNVCLGNYTRPSASTGTYQIVIGYDVTGSGNDTLTFGKQSTDTTCSMGGTTWTAPSDVRLKEDIQDEKVGLDFINELRPVTFQWKKAKDVPSEMIVHDPDSEERVMNGKHNHGFIAQEVKEVIDRYDLKDGFDMWTEDEADGRQRIGEAALMPIMVKAVQELSAQVEELKSKLNEE
jgi:hypothetical protein